MAFKGTPLVVDVGTGFTKLGYACNELPTFILPTVLGPRAKAPGVGISTKPGVEELDFYIGDECLANNKLYPPERFISHGLVTNWDLMEKFYEQIFWRYLRVNPEDQPIVITEAPLNTPENREYLAEIMFETFNVPSLYIAVQALLSICATWASKKQACKELTGTVIDAGDGVTHIIPVYDGQVIPSAIKQVPIAGTDSTQVILDTLREREGDVPPDEAMNIAKKVKEEFCYVTSDLVKEFQKFDSEPEKKFKQFTYVHPVTQRKHTFGVGYEQFLATEIFFSPSMYSSDFSIPIPVLVDNAIQQSPIDTRRALYGNVVLSGGSSMFPNFNKRIDKEVQEIVDKRLKIEEDRTHVAPKPIKVNVISGSNTSVFFGGGLLALSPQFSTLCKTKQQYDEIGPSICRPSSTFQALV